MAEFNFQKRVKDLRPRDYGEGVIVGYINEHPTEPVDPELWLIRWDDSGLDNEWLEEREFEVILTTSTARKVIVFPNGNIFVGDGNEQMPETQGSWINFDYLRSLAKVIARDSPQVHGIRNMPGIVYEAFISYLGFAKRESGRECTCNDYPHHELCGAVQDYPDSEGKKNG